MQFIVCSAVAIPNSKHKATLENFQTRWKVCQTCVTISIYLSIYPVYISGYIQYIQQLKGKHDNNGTKTINRLDDSGILCYNHDLGLIEYRSQRVQRQSG